MKQRYLGRSGLLVSELCLGTMTFGRETESAASMRMLDRFVEAGGSFIDTADVYAGGESETIIGKWLDGKVRDDYVIATKVRFVVGGKAPNTSEKSNDIGLGRKHIMAGVENSLRRLATDYIDLYQLHCWDVGAPLDETLSTLDQLVRSGKVRYVGVSNYKGYQLQKAIDMTRSCGLSPIVSLQPLYNLLDRYVEWELLELCRAEGVGVIPWSPLRGGWLSGKYRRDMQQPPKGTRLEKSDAEGWSERWGNYNIERTWSIVETLEAVAKELGKSPAQVALNWIGNRPGITAPIVGARRMDQLESNLGSVGWQMPDEACQRLDEVSRQAPPYPHDFVANANSSTPQTQRLS